MLKIQELKPDLILLDRMLPDMEGTEICKFIRSNKEIQRIRDELVSRVGVLEKWRHVLIGGSIVLFAVLLQFLSKFFSKKEAI